MLKAKYCPRAMPVQNFVNPGKPVHARAKKHNNRFDLWPMTLIFNWHEAKSRRRRDEDAKGVQWDGNCEMSPPYPKHPVHLTSWDYCYSLLIFTVKGQIPTEKIRKKCTLMNTFSSSLPFIVYWLLMPAFRIPTLLRTLTASRVFFVCKC